MRLTLLILITLMISMSACTKVKINSSVSVFDAVTDEVTDGDTTDLDVADVVASDVTPEAVGDAPDADVPTDGQPLDVDAEVDACVPACGDAVCGDDGCGGSCGTCVGLDVCFSGACCAPQCESKSCGDDLCGGICGTCADEDVCEDGTCVSGQVCVPDCQDQYCGDDGCGGSCGACGWLDGLNSDALDKDAALRELYEAGVDYGETAFTDELGGQLAAQGLPGAVSLKYPVTTGTAVDLQQGDLKCPFLANLSNEEPIEVSCDQWVNESVGAVYATVVAGLANPSQPPYLPDEVTSSPYGKDAEDAFNAGVITGSERGRARARWDLANEESPVCDATAGPVSASKSKGVYVGAIHFAAVLNSVLQSESFASVTANYPDIADPFELCTFSESLLEVAHDLASNFVPADLPVGEPCKDFNAAALGEEDRYAEATAEFLDGVSTGIDAEYYIASVAFFDAGECGLGP